VVVRPVLCRRQLSSLPVQAKRVSRSFPFAVQVVSRVHVMEGRSLKESDVPPHKSTLTVPIDDMKLPADQQTVLIELLGARYLSHKRLVRLVCNKLPTEEMNRNRVFQMLEAVLAESARLTEQFRNETVANADNANANTAQSASSIANAKSRRAHSVSAAAAQ